MTLYILKYNSYYNRIIKYENDMSDYEPYIVHRLPNTNFIPNNNIDTTHVFGVGEYDGSGDYLIAYDNDDIVSRWFITDATRTRAGQYQLTLHRDLIADYYNIIKDSPMFIEKATLTDADPLIYNNEDMTFNQIKQSETPLKDETDCAWIVGYMSSKDNVDGEGHKQNITSKIQYHLPVDGAYASKENYPFYKYSNLISTSERKSLIANPTDRKICVYFKTSFIQYGQVSGQKYAFNENGPQDTGILGAIGYSRDIPYTWLSATKDENYQCPRDGGDMIYSNSLATTETFLPSNSNVLKYLQEGFKNKYSEIWNLLDTQLNSVDVANILAENGKKVYFQDTNEYYNIKVTQNNSDWDEIKPSFNGPLWLALKNGYNATKEAYAANPYYSSEPTWADWTGITAEPNSYSFSINFTATTYTIELEKVPEPSLTYEIQIDNDRWHLNDAPYDMFCIPYSDDLILNNAGSYFCTANKVLAFQTALALSRDYMGAGYLYDVQLLPYCPVRECIQVDGTFDIQNANHYEIKSYREDSSYLNGEVVGTVLFSTRSNFTLDIPVNIPVTNKKIQANCDVWRLCSPNYSGLFEFNVAKNDGIEYVNVDCTYKPYNPYIHVNPNFKNLYGTDFNDVRGLVCGGEFSLPATTDSWKTYELNNKNYQNIFDRNIQSMELNNNIQYSKDIFNAITGTVTGGAGGALTGAMASGGNPYAAIAGGIIGTVASGIGGMVDVSTNKTLRNDALDLTKDQFGYQLGNIKALPYSLAKTSAFTANNKIFPFIEYYSCTATEKLALANKIAYNGMTVMRVGTLNEFVGNNWSYLDINSKNYIKGKLIRFNADESFNIVNTIADELFKGVYLE